MAENVKCSCGTDMRLKTAFVATRKTDIYLCPDCPLAWSATRQWIPSMKTWKFKLPNGDIRDDFNGMKCNGEFNSYYSYYIRRHL